MRTSEMNDGQVRARDDLQYCKLRSGGSADGEIAAIVVYNSSPSSILYLAALVHNMAVLGSQKKMKCLSST
jgi:hypothetical protein